jgi:sugar phosphate isomerase/epimerase
MRRRDFIGAMGVGAPLAMAAMGEAQTFATPEAVTTGGVTAAQMAAFDSPPFPEKGNDVKPAPRKGRIKQAATPGVFTARAVGAQQGIGPQNGGMKFDEMCRQAARLGLKGFDLIDPEDWPTLKKYGLVSTMMWGIGMGRGPVDTPHPRGGGPGGGPAGPRIVDKDAHDHFVQIYSDTIDLAAQNGVPNIILLTGAKGQATEENADNLVALLTSLKARAEDKGVTLCPELQDEPAAWLFGVVQRVNSPRCKVLFDIFHAQVMDGDIVSNIRYNWQWIGHFHTGGNPPVVPRAIPHANTPGIEGRNELDHTQEIYYPFIMKTIADMGFTDYVTHEWAPAPGMDPIASIEKCIRICDA